MSIRLGVIAALPFEAECFTRSRIRPGTQQRVTPDLHVYCAGMGPHNAGNAAQRLIAAKVDALVSWGFAGALDPGLVCGDTVLPLQVRDAEQQLYPINPAWHAALKSRLAHQRVYADGTLLSVPDVQDDVRLKSDLYQATRAVAVDMESAAVASVALNANLPFAAVRTIFDSATMRIPPSSTNATDQFGRVSITGLITGLLRKPGEVLQYPPMIASFIKAKKNLRQVAELCGHELCFPAKP